MSEWQDISTAPKHEYILLYGAKRLMWCVGKWDGGWETESTSECHNIYEPTHWMPLPPAPSIES